MRRRIAARAGLSADHADDALEPGPLEGRIDLLDHTTIAGWAFDVTRPHTPLRLEILVDNVVVGETLANLHRDDLRQAGKGEGRCAFRHHLAHPLTSNVPHAVRMFRIDDQTELLETPLLLDADPAQPGPLDGRIDVSDDNCVAGWALDILRPNIPIRLEIVAEGKLIGQTMAGCYRPDLEQAGLGNGRCSFMFRYGPGGAPCDPHLVQVRRASDQATLPMHREQQAAA